MGEASGSGGMKTVYATESTIEPGPGQVGGYPPVQESNNQSSASFNLPSLSAFSDFAGGIDDDDFL